MQSVFAQGYSTADLSAPGSDVRMISTDGFGDLVVEELSKL
jgi:3-isopropylmalate dehydrogenase